MWPCFCETAGLHVDTDVVLRFFGFPVDALDHDLLCALVAEKEPLVQLARNIIHALVVSEYPLGNRLTNLAHKALHIKVLKHAADNGVCQEVCGC